MLFSSMNLRRPGVPPINFGLCIPAVCPLNILEPMMNGLIQKKLQPLGVNGVSVKLLENTCQIEENDTKLKTIDKFAM